ncbi:terminase large subunit domain-containing protein [Streptosporangium sandarakinum]
MPAARVDGWPPRWLTPVPAADIARGDGEHCGTFIETLCRVTKDSVAGRAGAPIALRPWQRQLNGHLLARRPDGRYRHRQALIGVARKNGKSALGAGLALYGLVMGPEGGEVYSCAGEKEQAKIVFGTARRMVEMEPELADLAKCYRDAIEIPSTGSVYRALSAEAFTKEGLNPTTVLFDEVHVQPSRELWDVMALAMGARVEPLMVGITTAGVRSDSTGGDSLCYQLYQHGKRVVSGEVADPSFFMAWWEADAEADHRAPETWRQANPGFADLVAAEDFTSSVLRTPEAEFRTKRCNQWVSSAVTWLPAGAWEACADPGQAIEPHSRVVLGFDGSRVGDCTGLVAVSVGERPHVEVLGLWEKPGDQLEWTVPRAQVKDAIREACRRFDVVEIAWDEYLWLDAAEDLEAEGLPVVIFPQNISRMGPATQRMYEAVADRGVTHSGDPRLARHFANATTKTDARGTRIAKDKPNSPRKIDLAVCAVMALERAAWHAANVSDPMANIW